MGAVFERQTVDVETDVNLFGERLDNLPAQRIPRLARNRAPLSDRSSNDATRSEDSARAASAALKSRTPTCTSRVTFGTSRRTLYMIEAWEYSNPS